MKLKSQFLQLKNKFYFEGAFSFANFTLLNGIFLVGFAIALGANNLQLGILLAIPLFANLLQLTSAFILELTGTKKITTIVSLFIGRVIWIIAILAALGIIGNEKPFLLLALVLLFSSSFNAVGNLSMLSWIKDLIPLRKLARFLGKRNIYSSVGGVIVYLIGAYIVDKYTGVKIYGYLFLFAMVIGIIGLLYLIKIPERKKKIKAINPKTFIKRLNIPLHDTNFRNLLYFGMLWGFAINLAAPFFLVFMIDDLSISFFMISVFLLIESISKIYGLSVWRKIADKFGAKPLLVVSSTVTSMVPLAFIFINTKNYFLIPIIFIVSSISYAAVDLSIGQILFKSAPRKFDAYYLSSFTSLTSIMSALGPIIGGLLAVLIKNNYYGIPFMDILPPLKYLFILSFILRTTCIPLVSKINEPKAKDVSDIIERIKTLRFVSFFVKIYNFSEYASKIVLVPQKQLFILQRKTVEKTKRDITNIRATLSKISVSLNKKTITPYFKRRIMELKNSLNQGIDKLDYAEEWEMQKIPSKVILKMDSLELSMKKDSKKVINKKVKSTKKSVEIIMKKLDKTYEKEIK